MNKRIRELAQQMGWEEMGADLYGKSMDGCMTIHALEKFAELIVRECAKVCDDLDIDDWGDKSFDDGTYYCSRAIKQHFGVEEQEKVAPKPKCSVCGTTENVKYMGGYQPYLCDSVDCIPF